MPRSTGWLHNWTRRTDGGGSGKAGERLQELVHLAGRQRLAARHAGDLFQHLRPGRPADPLGADALHEERRLQRRAGLLAGQRDVVPARLVGV